MSWLINLSTRAKLLVGFGLMIVLLAIVMGAAYTGMAMILSSDQALVRQFTAATDIAEVRANMSRNRVNLLDAMRSADPVRRKEMISDIRDRSVQNDQILEKIARNVAGEPDLRDRLKEVRDIRQEYNRIQRKQFDLILAGAINVANVVAQANGQDKRYEDLRSLAQDLGDRMRERAESGIVISRRRAFQATQSFLLTGLIALALGAGMAWYLGRIIANPLRAVSAAAERIASGDLSDLAISSDQRADEVGVLTRTFGRMTESLREMAGIAEQMAEGDLRVRVMPQSEKDVLGNSFATLVENLQRMIGETTEAVNVLGTSASQILASTTELAASATETAAAVSETTATVGEIRQTAEVSSQKARQVAERAQNAVRIAQTGKKATEETTGGMNRIREQMNSIAQSMVRLSEQSQAIGEIIASVDDLAQQSNLLAVNAAIEAAKAGEQGKSFSVVAQEVKSLADQSKQATTQVRSILSDIQKATNAAALATEQGSKAVEAGVTRSAEAGESIQTLSESVAEAAQAASQIAASSQQQLVGMDQVVQAMQSVKQASAQNVDGARQLETAARGLAALGQRLKQQVERYQA